MIQYVAFGLLALVCAPLAILEIVVAWTLLADVVRGR
jgi:hypothetical protein